MDASSFNLLYNDIEKALLESRLQEALQGVQGLLYNISNPALSAEAETIRQDYSMMYSHCSTMRQEVLKRPIAAGYTLKPITKATIAEVPPPNK